MDTKNIWIWAAGGIAVLIVSAGIFFITLPKSPLPNRPPRPANTTNGVPASNNTVPTTPVTPAPSEKAPFVITTMTHMEGAFIDDENENVFEKHVSDLRWAMNLFDEYGAKLTVESEQPFAKANTLWGVNIMKEIVDRGHGVGTHADFGAGAGTRLTLDQLTTDFKTNKSLVDNLVGAENNQGVSGGTGPQDWVLAAAAAGFKYHDAVTGFGYLSMPESARPNGWSNAYIISTGYHDSIPPDLEDRIYPIPLKDAKDMNPDSNAATVVMSGDIGELASLAEGRNACFPNCILDQNDVDAVQTNIEDILRIRDASRFAKINFHIPMELLSSRNESLLRSMLNMIKTYTDKGELSWDTQLGAYKQYINWGK